MKEPYSGKRAAFLIELQKQRKTLKNIIIMDKEQIEQECRMLEAFTKHNSEIKILKESSPQYSNESESKEHKKTR